MARCENIGLIYNVFLLGLTGASYMGATITTPAPTPICEDVFRSECGSYGHAICSKPRYSDWVNKNCRRFCGVCQVTTPAPPPCPNVKLEPQGMVCETRDIPVANICFTEGGVSLQSTSMIRYNFSQLYDVGYNLDLSRIMVVFSTRRRNGILLQLKEPGGGGSSMSLEVNNNGGVKFFLDIGYERWEMNTDIDDSSVTDGRPHTLLVQIGVFQDGRRGVQLQLDDKSPSQGYLRDSVADAVFQEMTQVQWFIGNNDTSNPTKAFVGTIHAAMIGDLDLIALAFLSEYPIVQLIDVDRVCLYGNSTYRNSTTTWSKYDQTCSDRNVVVLDRPAVFGFCQVSPEEGSGTFPECNGKNTSYVNATLTEHPGRRYQVCAPKVEETTTTTTSAVTTTTATSTKTTNIAAATTGCPLGGAAVSSCPGMSGSVAAIFVLVIGMLPFVRL